MNRLSGTWPSHGKRPGARKSVHKTMALQTLTFDDEVISPHYARKSILRCHGVTTYRQLLLERQRNEKGESICPVCKLVINSKDDAEVDHIVPVKWFAQHTEIDINEAFIRCHS